MSHKVLIFLFLAVCSYLPAPDQCDAGGGTCTTCVATVSALCVEGDNNNLMYNDGCTGFFADGCAAQTDMTCICANCAGVNIASGVWTCKTAGCGGGCTPVPEFSANPWLFIPFVFGILWAFSRFLRQKKNA